MDSGKGRRAGIRILLRRNGRPLYYVIQERHTEKDKSWEMVTWCGLSEVTILVCYCVSWVLFPTYTFVFAILLLVTTFPLTLWWTLVYPVRWILDSMLYHLLHLIQVYFWVCGFHPQLTCWLEGLNLFYPPLSRFVPCLADTMWCSRDICWSTGVKSRNYEPGCLGWEPSFAIFCVALV